MKRRAGSTYSDKIMEAPVHRLMQVLLHAGGLVDSQTLTQVVTEGRPFASTYLAAVVRHARGSLPEGFRIENKRKFGYGLKSSQLCSFCRKRAVHVTPSATRSSCDDCTRAYKFGYQAGRKSMKAQQLQCDESRSASVTHTKCMPSAYHSHEENDAQ